MKQRGFILVCLLILLVIGSIGAIALLRFTQLDLKLSQNFTAQFVKRNQSYNQLALKIEQVKQHPKQFTLMKQVKTKTGTVDWYSLQSASWYAVVKQVGGIMHIVVLREAR